MVDASAERENLVRSLIIWAIALVAGIIVAWIIGGLFGLGAAPGLIFGAAVFVVLPYLIALYGGASAAAVATTHGAPAPHSVPPVSLEPAPAPEAPAQPLADLGARPEAADEAPVAAISERVREAARAAGEAARAAVGDVAAGERPAALDAPRGGAPDDLKRIKGVGPKIETMLHGLGIYHFDQIAGWDVAEVAWMDANLEGFLGRVTRDGWVEQAAMLAGGGETEFSRRVDRGEVY
jgi:predicted flap endonuclease-1-like 5' DNA nuclease